MESIGGRPWSRPHNFPSPRYAIIFCTTQSLLTVDYGIFRCSHSCLDLVLGHSYLRHIQRHLQTWPIMFCWLWFLPSPHSRAARQLPILIELSSDRIRSYHWHMDTFRSQDLPLPFMFSTFIVSLRKCFIPNVGLRLLQLTLSWSSDLTVFVCSFAQIVCLVISIFFATRIILGVSLKKVFNGAWVPLMSPPYESKWTWDRRARIL